MASLSRERVSAFQEATMYEVDVPKRIHASDDTHASKTNGLRRLNFNYKPLILRSASLLSLLALTVALIGILQYAVVRLPHDSTTPTMQDLNLTISKREIASIVPRATNNSTSTSITSTTTSSTTSSSSQLTISSTTSSTVSSLTTESSQTTPSVTESTYTTHTSSSLTSPSPTPTSSVTTVTPGLHLSNTPVTQNAVPSDYVPTDAKYTTISSTTYVTTGSTISSSAPIFSPSNSGNTSDSDRNNRNGSSNADFQGNVVLAYPGWNVESTFIGTYLAVLLAVLYRMLWTMVYNAFNLIDPFRQLMQPSGASAGTAFFTFYQAQSNLLGPIPALLNRRWALSLIATTYTLVNLLPALASESIFVTTNYKCPDSESNSVKNPCPPKLAVNVATIRTLQGLLAFVAAALLASTSSLLFGKTGIPSDPRSMATIGSLMHHPGLLADLNEIPVHATSAETKQIVNNKRYSIGFYKTETGEDNYGIRPESNSEAHDSGARANHGYTPVDGSFSSHERRTSKLLSFKAMDFVLGVLILGTLGLILAYCLDTNRRDGLNRFFNSSTFGPRFIMTLAGTVIAAVWKSTEQSCLLMAPYTRLAQRPSPPSGTILFKPDSTPVVSTVRAISHGYILAGAITVVTLLGEGLNVVISGIPYASGETYMQYQVSAYMSIGILGVMIIVAAFLIFSRFREAKLPRQPDTLGAVMSYMCGSRMLDDFEGMACLAEATRDNRIGLMRKTYELKETLRKDGKVAWTLDEALGRPVY